MNDFNFNPKNDNLLDQQLSVSGLEMGIAPWVAPAVGTLIGAFGGYSSTSSSNKAARKAAKAQKKFQKKLARYKNKYQKQFDAVEKKNYERQVKFEYNNAIDNWKYQTLTQNFQYLNTLKQYERSLALGNANLGLNKAGRDSALDAEIKALKDSKKEAKFAAKQNMVDLKRTLIAAGFEKKSQKTRLKTIAAQEKAGQRSIQMQMNEKADQGALEKQNKVVEGILADGQASLAAPGRSGAKGKQAGQAAVARAITALDVEIKGSRRNAALQLAELEVQTGLQARDVKTQLQVIDEQIRQAFSDQKFNANMIEENLRSQIDQVKLNVKDINLQKMAADIDTRSNMMLFPKKLAYLPQPKIPPMKIFLESMKAIPGYVPPPQKQSVFAGIMSGAQQGLSIAQSGTDLYKSLQ